VRGLGTRGAAAISMGARPARNARESQKKEDNEPTGPTIAVSGFAGIVSGFQHPASIAKGAGGRGVEVWLFTAAIGRCRVTSRDLPGSFWRGQLCGARAFRLPATDYPDMLAGKTPRRARMPEP